MTSTTIMRRMLRDDVGKRDWVDFVKGAAIILIVAYHTVLFVNSIGFEAGGVGRVKLVLELFPMPAFFLISGIFAARIGSWTFSQLWKRRLRQYLYLYVLWSVIRFLFYLVAPNVRSDGAGVSASDPLALLGILVWPISSYWFIYALFLFTLVVWSFRRLPPWVLVALAAVLSVLSSSGILDVGNGGWNRMTEYLVFFVLGAVLYRRVYDWVEGQRPWHAAVTVGAFAVLGLVVSRFPAVGAIPGVALVGQLLAVACGYALAFYLVRLTFLRWVVYVGVRSLNVYLVHIFVIALLVIPVLYLPWLDDLPGRGMLLIAVLVVIVVSVSILITRYLTRVTWLFVYPFQQGLRLRRRRPDGVESTDRT